MMDGALPGLQRLISVLKEHGIAVTHTLPNRRAPRAGELVLGEPFDPILATVYSRSGGGLLGDLGLCSLDDSRYGIVPFNVSLRGEDALLQRALIYGVVSGFAYYFGTIPSLANPNGLQPVVYMDRHEIPLFLPIASNVDRFFDLYADYCEVRIRRYGTLDGFRAREHTSVKFPGDFVDHVARDPPLVRMLEEKRFDDFVLPEADSRDWVERVVRAARLLH